MADLGRDISAWPDLDTSFAMVEGRTAYAQAIARRCVTRKGSLPFHPSYGFDVRAFLNEAISTTDLHRIKAGVEDQAAQDERTVDAQATVTFTAGALRLDLLLDTGDGPFPLTLTVDQVSTTLLLG